MIVNIRCWCCTLVKRCSECVIEEQRRQQWRQPKLRLKAQQETMVGSISTSYKIVTFRRLGFDDAARLP